MHGEDAVGWRGQQREGLLQDVGYQAQAEDYPEGDRGGGVPGVGRAAKGDDDHEESEDGAVEGRAKPVDVGEFLGEREVGARVAGWEDEDEDGGEDAHEWEVDVECLGEAALV